jgi:hypothetical protein
MSKTLVESDTYFGRLRFSLRFGTTSWALSVGLVKRWRGVEFYLHLLLLYLSVQLTVVEQEDEEDD